MHCIASPARTAFLLLLAALAVSAQQIDSDGLNASGQVMVNGRPTPYLIRHLPVNAFPQLPPAIQDALTRRGCLIPQTYEAHGPENVVHASLERPGSSDWAVLCSASGTVSLLVFFGDASAPVVLDSTAETSRLQAHGGTSVLGFNWAIDPASPGTVREAQLDTSAPPNLDHDALVDSVIDRQTTYRFYINGAWTVVATQD